MVVVISVDIYNAAFIEQRTKPKGHKFLQMYMQILEWCIAINTTNGFQRLHKFREEK